MTYSIHKLREENPCKQDCERRSPEYHGTCKDYLEWKDKFDKTNKELRAKKDRESFDAHLKTFARRYPRDYIWKK